LVPFNLSRTPRAPFTQLAPALKNTTGDHREPRLYGTLGNQLTNGYAGINKRRFPGIGANLTDHQHANTQVKQQRAKQHPGTQPAIPD